MVITSELIMSVAAGIISLSAAGTIVYKALIQPRMGHKEYRELQAHEEIKQSIDALSQVVKRSYTLSCVNARTTIAMAEELSHDGQINGKTTESIEKLRDVVYSNLEE